MQERSKECIVVLGMHRSGTSSLTRLISFAGAMLPNTLIESLNGNEKGHWESKKIVNNNEAFLAAQGLSWDDWRPLKFNKKQSIEFVERTKALIDKEYAGKNFIVLKDPRFCRYPDLLADALTQLGFAVKFVIITRNPLEVSGSLMKRNDFSEAQSNLLWLRYVLDAEYLTRDFDRTFVTFDQVIHDWKTCLTDIASQLDITWLNALSVIEKKAALFIDPSLKHHNKLGLSNEVYDLTGSWFAETYRILENASNTPEKGVDRKSLDNIKSHFGDATPSILPIAAIERTAHVTAVDLNNKIKHIKSEKSQIKLDLKRKLNDIKAFKDEQNKRGTDIAAFQKEQKNLVSTIKQKNKDIGALKDEQKNLVSSIKQKNKDIVSLKGEQAKRVDDIAAFQKEQESLVSTIKRKDKDISALKDEQANQKNVVELREAEIEGFTEKVCELEGAVARETALSSHKSNQINEILNSRSWRLLSFPRKMSTLWKSKTLYLVKLLSGTGPKDIDANSTATSKTTRLARRDLAASRSLVLNSKWHTALLGVENDLPAADLPNITISAVTFNSEKWLWNFFISVVALDYPAEKISIHFVDNGSTDDGIKGIESFIATHKHRYKNLELFRRPNKGYGVGNDYGIRQSKDEFVLVTNVDTEFYPDSLKNAVTVAVNDTSDVACWEFRQTPYEHPKFYDPITFLTNWTSHACVLIRKKAYIEIGGYDHKIFMYGEDVELSYRFRAHGWKLRYVPSAVIKHYVDLEDSTLRPNQLSGSVAANILLRYRFGSYYDILAGEALFGAVKANEKDPLRMTAWSQVNKIVNKNRWHFFRKRKLRTKAHFPFNEFDYDITRPGAAVKTAPFKDLNSQELPKISVITRTHGKALEHLENVITSVLNQTYKNIEHIIVEDRTDDGKDVVAPLTARYGNRVRYIKSDGSGRSYCGNYGALQATGDYVCFLDNDDVFYADHIETLVLGLSATPNAVCSYSLAWDALSETNNGHIEETEFLLPELHCQPYDKERFLKENFIPIQAIIFEKKLFDSYGGFNETFSQLEDWNLWARYAQLGPFAFTPKVTSFYRTPLNSQIRQDRHAMLHDAYNTVQKANFEDIAKIHKKLRKKDTAQKVKGRKTS